jgi:hypothetical protein
VRAPLLCISLLHQKKTQGGAGGLIQESKAQSPKGKGGPGYGYGHGLVMEYGVWSME